MRNRLHTSGRIRVWAVLTCALLFPLGAAGCGGISTLARVSVNGEVTVNGQPMEKGAIKFVSLVKKDGGHRMNSGAVITDGQYEIGEDKGPIAGDYEVQITSYKETGETAWDGMGDDSMSDSEKNYVPVTKMYIPYKYNFKSELKATLKAGANQEDFDLTVEEDAP